MVWLLKQEMDNVFWSSRHLFWINNQLWNESEPQESDAENKQHTHTQTDTHNCTVATVRQDEPLVSSSLDNFHFCGNNF